MQIYMFVMAVSLLLTNSFTSANLKCLLSCLRTLTFQGDNFIFSEIIGISIVHIFDLKLTI